jgi:hypothetical protein
MSRKKTPSEKRIMPLPSDTARAFPASAMFALLIVASGLFPLFQVAAQTPSLLAPYLSVRTYCGKDPIPQNIATMPWIGCFSLSAGHSATGTFSNQNVEVAVDAGGQEIFTVNGTVVVEKNDPQRRVRGTNLSYVHVEGVAGFSICPDTAGPENCPSSINIYSRNPDKSVIFMVSECLPPQYHLCVLSQENWDYQKTRPQY